MKGSGTNLDTSIRFPWENRISLGLISLSSVSGNNLYGIQLQYAVISKIQN